MSRDTQSTNHLQTLAPSFEPKGYPDIAWLFEGVHASVGTSHLTGLGWDSASSLIALVPNMRVYEKTGGKGAANPYLKGLATLARHAMRSSGASILLLPNEIRIPSSHAPDDRYLCGILETLIGNRKTCFTLRHSASAEELKSILSRCDAVVASRFHSLIFALSSGVPSLAIGWSHKYTELMNSLEMGGYAVSCDTPEIPDLTGLFDTLWSRRDEFGKTLRTKVAVLKQQAAGAFDLAVNFAAKHSPS